MIRLIYLRIKRPIGKQKQRMMLVVGYKLLQKLRLNNYLIKNKVKQGNNLKWQHIQIINL